MAEVTVVPHSMGSEVEKARGSLMSEEREVSVIGSRYHEG